MILYRDLLVDFFPSFKDIDPDANTYRIGVPALSCLISLSIFVVTYILSLPLSGFQRLSPSQKVFWAATVVRGLFGFWSIIFGLWYLLLDDNLHIDIIREHDVTSHFLCYINLGFFVFECSCLILSNISFRQFDLPLMLHHVVSLIMFSLIVYYDCAHFVGIVSALLEMTTPFSCICWLLLKLGKQHTKVWSVNQNILIHLFHCRSVLEFYWWWQTYKHWDSIVAYLPLPLMLDIYVGLISTTFFLTPYWTMKKTEQYFKRQDWNHPGKKKQPTSTVVKKVENGFAHGATSLGNHSVHANGVSNGSAGPVFAERSSKSTKQKEA